MQSYLDRFNCKGRDYDLNSVFSYTQNNLLKKSSSVNERSGNN